MPNNVNAKKAMRQNEKARLRNRAVRTALRTVIRKVRDAAAGTDPVAKEAAFKLASKRLDQAAARNYIHRNKAARLKSRLSRLLAAPAAATT